MRVQDADHVPVDPTAESDDFALAMTKDAIADIANLERRRRYMRWSRSQRCARPGSPLGCQLHLFADLFYLHGQIFNMIFDVKLIDALLLSTLQHHKRHVDHDPGTAGRGDTTSTIFTDTTGFITRRQERFPNSREFGCFKQSGLQETQRFFR